MNYCLDPKLDKFVRKNAKVRNEYSHCERIGKRIYSLIEELQLQKMDLQK